MEIREQLIEVGSVGETNIFPFKGMQGVAMDEVVLRSVSVVGDRIRSFAVMGGKLLDTTKFPGLLQYRTSLTNPANPKTIDAVVHTPDGRTLPADSPELLEEITQRSGRRVVNSSTRIGRGLYHSMPVSIISNGSIQEIDRHLGYSVDPRRYRQNIHLNIPGDPAYIEDAWIKMTLQFGDRPDSARVTIMKPDRRCATVNMDPETGVQDPQVLRTIVREHNTTLGVYATIVKEGTVRRGDRVYIVTQVAQE